MPLLPHFLYSKQIKPKPSFNKSISLPLSLSFSLLIFN